MAAAELPNRSLFKAPEVCEIAQLQPYVLRSWEAEFPDLGVTRSGSAVRVYRRHDVERVLRLKHLLFVEGLTLAGARRRLEEESTPLPELTDVETGLVAKGGRASGSDKKLRRQLEQVQQGLRGLLEILERDRTAAEAFRLEAGSSPTRAKSRGSSKEPARPAKPAKARR
jgi:DNA-binding transcriptional MerR regulator